VADLVPLDRSNRILVRQGLLRIRAARCRPGIVALCEVAGLDPGDVTEAALGYHLGPRLNAAGRLDDMTLGIRCLMSDEPADAARLARELDLLNRERRQLEERMKEEARQLVELPVDIGVTAPIACLFHEDWHEGLVGLVAARMRERLHRPVIAFAPSGPDLLKGSGRSVPGFHLRDALAEIDARHSGLIQRYGGHAMAAGLSLARTALDAFRGALEAVGTRLLTPELLAQQIDSDGELAADAHTLELAMLLREAGPWGQAFPEPRFDGCFELVQLRVLRDRHLQMRVRPLTGEDCLVAIAFNRPEDDWAVGEVLRLVYRLTVNDYNGSRRVQLVVEHIESARLEAGHGTAC
jgi:single-stranded-DNA-specific exonuclease